MATQSGIRIADSQAIKDAVRALDKGLLVGFPTETVYGLGGDARRDKAVAAIFKAKKRPPFNPLIIHFVDATAAEQHVIFDQRARLLAQKFWPGPLTLVLKRRTNSSISLLAASGLDTLAVRVPAAPVARTVLQQAQRPIAAPSANPSGCLSPTTAAHVAAGLGDKVAIILDGGPCRIGIESSVIDLSSSAASLLRPGGIPEAQITAIIGALTQPPKSSNHPRSPGCLSRHYAPRLPLRLEATTIDDDEALLSFGPHTLRGFIIERNLSPQGNLGEAAVNLFSMLHELERSTASRIAVMPIPGNGLGQAINDRLRRAAAPNQPSLLAATPSPSHKTQSTKPSRGRHAF